MLTLLSQQEHCVKLEQCHSQDLGRSLGIFLPPLLEDMACLYSSSEFRSSRKLGPTIPVRTVEPFLQSIYQSHLGFSCSNSISLYLSLSVSASLFLSLLSLPPSLSSVCVNNSPGYSVGDMFR